MSDNDKKWVFAGLFIVSLCATFFVVFCANKATDTVTPTTVVGVKETIVSEEVIKTSGDWSFVPTDERDFHLRFDFSSIPEILNRFERRHPNLSILDWDILYDTVMDSPHGILIRHTPK